MSDFKPITTQEEFDAAIGARLERERKTVEKSFEGYLSPEAVSKKYEGYLSAEDVQKKYEGYLSPEEASAKDAQIRKYETSSVKMRIAHEKGIPFEMAERLSGENEEDIRKDAEVIARFVNKKQGAPSKSNEPSSEDSKRAAMQKMLQEMKGE